MAARATGSSEIDWTKAVYPPWQIIAKYSLPVSVKVASSRTTSSIPNIDGQIFNLQNMVRVEQVTANIEIPSRNKNTKRPTSHATENPIVLNIPQMYRGLFQIASNKENSVSLEGIEEIIKVMPRYVKVLECATNIPKQALITLREGDLMEISGTCKRATRDGIKQFLRCTANNRTMVFNPTWNGVYEVVQDEVMYSMSDLLKRFPLPVTVKLAKLENHSKALLDRLPNGGKSCHLVLTSMTNSEFVLGIDEDCQMGLIMAESINIGLHIPTWVSPSNSKERRMSSNNAFVGDLRLNQVICGCKEMLILWKPWRELFMETGPELPTREKKPTRRHGRSRTDPKIQAGYYTNQRGALMRNTVDEILYISGPIIPQDTPPEPPPRRTGTLLNPSKKSSMLSSGDRQSNLSRSCPDLAEQGLLQKDLNLNLDKYGYLKLSDEDTSSDSEDDEGYLIPISDSDLETESIPKDPTAVFDRPGYIHMRNLPEGNEKKQPSSEKLSPEDKTTMKPHEVMLFEEMQKEIRQKKTNRDSKSKKRQQLDNPELVSPSSNPDNAKVLSKGVEKQTPDPYWAQEKIPHADPRTSSYGQITKSRDRRQLSYENSSLITFKSRKHRPIHGNDADGDDHSEFHHSYLPAFPQISVSDQSNEQSVLLDEAPGDYENIPDKIEERWPTYGSDTGRDQWSETDHPDVSPSNYENVSIPDTSGKRWQTYECDVEPAEQTLIDQTDDQSLPFDESPCNYENVSIQSPVDEDIDNDFGSSEEPIITMIGGNDAMTINQLTDDQSNTSNESPCNYENVSIPGDQSLVDENINNEFGASEKQITMTDGNDVRKSTPLARTRSVSNPTTQSEQSIYPEHAGKHEKISATLRKSFQGTAQITSFDSENVVDEVGDDEYDNIMPNTSNESKDSKNLEPIEDDQLSLKDDSRSALHVDSEEPEQIQAEVCEEVDDVYEDVLIEPSEGKDTSNSDKSDGVSKMSEEQTQNTTPPELPKSDELERLSVNGVIKTLQSLQIPMPIQDHFRKQQVDGNLLKFMDESILQEEFGMKAFHAMKLKKFIDGWRPQLD